MRYINPCTTLRSFSVNSAIPIMSCKLVYMIMVQTEYMISADSTQLACTLVPVREKRYAYIVYSPGA